MGQRLSVGLCADLLAMTHWGLAPFYSLPKCCVLAACGRFGWWGYVGDVELVEFRLRVLCGACGALDEEKGIGEKE